MGGSLRGPMVVPGNYQVKMTSGDQTVTQSLAIKQNPNVSTRIKDYQKQFDFLILIRDKLSETHNAVNLILDLKKEIDGDMDKTNGLEGADMVSSEGEKLKKKLTAVLNELVELRFTGLDDQTLMYPLKLNNRIASLQRCAGTDTKPTDQCYENFDELSAELDVQLEKLSEIMESDVPAFKNLLKE